MRLSQCLFTIAASHFYQISTEMRADFWLIELGRRVGH